MASFDLTSIQHTIYGVFCIPVLDETDFIKLFVKENPNTSIAIVMVLCMVCVEFWLFAAETRIFIKETRTPLCWKTNTIPTEEGFDYIEKRKQRLDYASVVFSMVVTFVIAFAALAVYSKSYGNSNRDQEIHYRNTQWVAMSQKQLRIMISTSFLSICSCLLASLVFDNRLHMILQKTAYIMATNRFAPKDFDPFWRMNIKWVARLWTLVSIVKYASLWVLVYPCVCDHAEVRSGFILVFFLFGCDFMTIICPINILFGFIHSETCRVVWKCFKYFFVPKIGKGTQ
jgi:hypothetical protein